MVYNQDLTESEIRELAVIFAQLKVSYYMNKTETFDNDEALNVLVHSYKYAIKQIPNEETREVEKLKRFISLNLPFE